MANLLIPFLSLVVIGRRPSGSPPPPAQRHSASYPERRDDRREDPKDRPNGPEPRRREKASRFGPSVANSKVEDFLQREKEYDYSPEAHLMTAVRPRDAQDFRGEVIYSTDGRNGQREPLPSGMYCLC